MQRMFVAIGLPGDVCWRLGRLVADAPCGVRPVRPAQMHLTLHFLGDVPEESRATLRERLRQVVAVPFSLAIRGTGVFPPHGRPSVLWAGVDAPAALPDLHAVIGEAITASGVAVEPRPYTPHVTLARLSPDVPRGWTSRFLTKTSTLDIAGVTVDRFSLFVSRRLDGTTRHEVDTSFPLSGAGRVTR